MPVAKRARTSYAPRRRRATFRKRVSRKRFTRSKRMAPLPNYRFHRWVTALSSVNVSDCTYDLAASVVTQTLTKPTISFSLSFSMDDLPNKTEFTTLFDSYMITGVMIQIKMLNVPDSIYPTNITPVSGFQLNNFYPTIWYSPDHDDNGTITLAAIKEYAKVRHKVLRPNQELSIMLRPTTLQQIYRSAVTTGYAENRRRQWLDIAATDIPHYGCKFVIDFEGLTPTSSDSFKFKVNAKYFFACKSVR